MDPYRTLTEKSQPSEIRSLTRDRQSKENDDNLRLSISRQNKADEKQKKLDDAAAALMKYLEDATESGWSTCTRPSSLRLTSPLRYSTTCLPSCTRSTTPISVVNSFLPKHLFEKLQTISEGAAKIAFKKRGNRHLSHHFRPSPCDIRKHFFHRLLFSVDASRKAIADHFMSSNRNGKYSLMPQFRYEYLNSNLVYHFDHFSISDDAQTEIDSFYDLCRMNMWAHWVPASNLAFDELVLPYQGNTKLITHIPRKPHETGLLLYLLGMETQNGDSVILDFFPIDRQPKVPGQDCFISMMNRVADLKIYETVRPHFYVDALFGGTESVERGSVKNCFVTASVKDVTERSLLEVLSYGLQERKFRVAHKPLFDNWYTTFLTFNDNAVVNVASNSVYCSDDFRFNSSGSSSSSSSVSSSTSSSSSSTVSTPSFSAVSTPSSSSELETTLPSDDRFRTIGLTMEEAKGLTDYGDQHPRALRLISQRCGVRPEASGGAALNLVSRLTGYSISDLSRKRPRSEDESNGESNGDEDYNKKSVKALAAMLKERKLDDKGSKDQLIRRLKWDDGHKQVNPSEQLLKFAGPSLQGPPSIPPFTQYLDHFNYIDKFNRNFYDGIGYKHKETDPVHIFVWSLLNILFLNAWAAFREMNPSERNLSIQDFSISCINSVLNENEFFGELKDR